MSKEVIFKTFRTYGHPYVYDRHTNSLVMISEDEVNELLQVEEGKLLPEQSKVVKNYQDYGLFMPNIVDKIEHSGTAIIEQYLKTRMRQLTLQVTQQCNLRCEYCVYSGIYEHNRTHSNKRMNLETAQKAVDFFLARNSELAEVVIGFYGGEPLLEFDLIKQCVEYAKSQVEGKKINFNMTTNGTLLSGNLVDYLVENDFYLNISLDGSKEEHDVSRKFVNGEGSFDMIMNNIKRINERYPEYIKNISFMTTINPHVDLSCVLEYFSSEEIFNDKNIIYNTMVENSSNQDITYDKKYYMVRNYEYIKMLFSLIGKLDRKHVSPLVMGSREMVKYKQERLRKHTKMVPIEHHNGPCLPGVQRLFVRVDGALFPCERVNEAIDYFKIGTLEEGIDENQIKKIMNIGKVTENECKNCWNLKQCTLCAGQIEFETEPSRKIKLNVCPQSCNNILFELHELCVLNEFGLDTEEIMRVV